MSPFVFDTVLDGENICNLDRERKTLCEGVANGKHLVVFGRRNTGKTSVMQSIVIPTFRRQNRKSFVLFADLLNVRDLSEVCRRLQMAFQTSYSESFPTRALFDKMLQAVSNLRPTISVDPLTGSPSLLVTFSGATTSSLSGLFLAVKKIAKDVPVLIVFDEFQDIHLIEGAEALFRQELQNLNPKTPVVLLGSKKHLLANIFARQEAPLYNWGEDVEFQPLPYGEYTDYINARLASHRLVIPGDVSKHLQDALDRIPEPINMIGSELIEMRLPGKGTSGSYSITVADIGAAIDFCIKKRVSRFEEYLGGFSGNEERVLAALAHEGPVSHPGSKLFVSQTGVSSKGVSLLVKKMLDDAVLYQGGEGLVLSDPLLKYFLRRYRAAPVVTGARS